MPKIIQKRFTGGKNTRMDSNDIRDDQSVELRNIDLTEPYLKAIADKDTGTTPSANTEVYHYGASAWVGAENANSYTEYNDILYYSRDDWTEPGTDTVLLIESDTTDGSTTFSDSSSSAHTVNNVTAVSHQTEYFKTGGSSIYFNGSHYLGINDHDDFHLGGSVFSIDFWIKPMDLTADFHIFGTGTSSSSGRSIELFWDYSIHSLCAQMSTSGTAITHTAYYKTLVTGFSNKDWVHIALSRRTNSASSSSSLDLFINGRKSNDSMVDITSLSIHNPASTFYIGKGYAGSSLFTGYIDQFRVVNGTCVFPDNFDPSITIPPYELIPRKRENGFLEYNLGVLKPLEGDPVISANSYVPIQADLMAHDIGTTRDILPSGTQTVDVQYIASYVDRYGAEGEPCSPTEGLTIGSNTFVEISTSGNHVFKVPGPWGVWEFPNFVYEKINLYRVGPNNTEYYKVANLFARNIAFKLTDNGTYETLDLYVYDDPYRDHKYNVVWESTGTDCEIRTNGTSTFSQNGETGWYEPTAYDAVKATIKTIDINKKGTSSTHNMIITVKVVREGYENDVMIGFMFVATPTSSGIDLTPTAYGKFCDYVPDSSVLSITPQYDNLEPQRGLEHLTEANNFFFASKGSRLYISRKGLPDAWPLDGYLDFKLPITGIAEYHSEAIVFTGLGVYRVFGNYPNEMRSVKLPTTNGLPSGYHKSIQALGQLLVWVNAEGLCAFNGVKVEVVSKHILNDFTATSSHVSGVYKEKYYLLNNVTNEGYIVDFRDGIRIQESGETATMLFYRADQDKLYSTNGVIEQGSSTKSALWRSKSYDGGDFHREKVLHNIKMKVKITTATSIIGNLYMNDEYVDAFTINSSAFTPYNLGDFCTVSIHAPIYTRCNTFAIEFTPMLNWELHGLEYNYDFCDEYDDRIYHAVKVTYKGSVTVKVDIDGTNKISESLSQNGIDTEGIVSASSLSSVDLGSISVADDEYIEVLYTADGTRKCYQNVSGTPKTGSGNDFTNVGLWTEVDERGGTEETTVYFPAMTVGSVPHWYDSTNSVAGEILKVQFITFDL